MCVRVYIHTYIHTHTHACIHTYTTQPDRTHKHTNTPTVAPLDIHCIMYSCVRTLYYVFMCTPTVAPLYIHCIMYSCVHPPLRHFIYTRSTLHIRRESRCLAQLSATPPCVLSILLPPLGKKIEQFHGTAKLLATWCHDAGPGLRSLLVCVCMFV